MKNMEISLIGKFWDNFKQFFFEILRISMDDLIFLEVLLCSVCKNVQ